MSQSLYFDSSNSNFTVDSDDNTITSSSYSTIAGGKANEAVTSTYSTISGGQSNKINADHASIVGGHSNIIGSNSGFIGGGTQNNISGRSSVIMGGAHNKAGGRFGTITGGQYNTIANAADFSMTSGQYTNVGNSNSATFGFSSVLDASNLCQSSQDGQVRFCADSLDLSQVARIDWGDHLEALVSSLAIDPSNVVVPTSTSIQTDIHSDNASGATGTSSGTGTVFDNVEWYLSPVFFISVGTLLLVLILFTILAIKLYSKKE